MSLEEFLNSKGVEYAPFDPSRFQNFVSNSPKLTKNLPKIVQIVGTNGKGTTGRFLAQMLKNNGLKVGHFTSPHIISITERFWFDGADASQEELEKCFAALVREIGEGIESLSYFEILTTLCIAYFKDISDVIVMEAGVGGEFDSTTAFKKELLLVTPIGMDHMQMLGESVDEIARTKLRASNCETIIGFQSYDAVDAIVKKEFSHCKFISAELRKDEISAIVEYASKNFNASYLSQNLALAYAAVKKLGYKPILDAIKPPFGRFEKIAPNVIIDVGHNEDAAKKIATELSGKNVTLIFNCYADKEPFLVLSALKDVVQSVEIIDIKSDRAIEKEKLIKILDKIKIPHRDFQKVDEKREYLVFGSFVVAAEFLRRMFEKTE